MCGIVGFITKHRVDSDLVAKMGRALVHRGPDDEGYWIDEERGIALGHRRLSIVDLSSQGHQPMHSRCGRYVIAFNGEVYNFSELRRQVDAHAAGGALPWRGHSDTEVMLAAISVWGFEAALRKFSGMFAIALWDREEHVLHLVRDRLGEKPLYYGEMGSSFAFASELKALRVFPNTDLEVDRSALADLLRFGYIPSPKSIYRGIQKLGPGSLLSVRVSQAGHFQYGAVRKYWSLDRSGEHRGESITDEASAVEQLHALLRVSVRRQLISDVPLGAFLSGGIDSSTVVALMQAQSSKPIRTFTIGFQEQAFNEAPYAKAVAAHLGTEHTEFYVTPTEASAVIPHLPDIYDEPFADSSQIPTILVSRLTRRHVTVSLSGDGGDELFAGYPRYQFAGTLWGRIQRLPAWGRWAASRSIGGLSAQSWDRILCRVLPEGLRSIVSGHRLHRFAGLLDANGFEEMYARLVSQCQQAETIVLGGQTTETADRDTEDARERASLLNRMRAFDIEQYLPDDLLVKVDRASMSVSLESRAPMLDHGLVEFAWALPQNLLVRNGQSKWILRQVLSRYVPSELTDRPKSGLRLPVAQWLRGSLREWAEHLLDESAIRAKGFLDPAPVRTMWEEHLSGRQDRSSCLWNVLMFQAWLGQASRSPSSPATPLVQAA